jgi:hypothetical protein
MEILNVISSYAKSRNLSFVIIGGHAVVAHGSSRRTGDIDFLVSINQKNDWIKLITALQYDLGQNDSRFARFQPQTIAQWPIDLMFVAEDVFEKILKDSIVLPIDSISVPVISKQHLAILKLHALKYYQEHRFDKDYTDLTELLRKNPKLFTISELKEACLKYANKELFDRILKDLNLSNE